MTTVRYGKGLRGPSDAHKVAHRLAAASHPAIADRLAAGTGGGADLGPFLSPRKNQGVSETCFAHSGSSVTYAAYAAAGIRLPFDPSPVLIASLTYARERNLVTPVGTMPQALRDTGAQLADVAAVIAEYGVKAIQAPTSDGRYSDVPTLAPDDAFPEPDAFAAEQAATQLVFGEYKITPNDSSSPKVVAASLDAGIPVWLGFLCDTAFEALNPGQVAQPANTNDPKAGGHAEYISAYRINAQGQLEFRVENSWGEFYCENGACWASSAWLRACWELWPFAVARGA